MTDPEILRTADIVRYEADFVRVHARPDERSIELGFVDIDEGDYTLSDIHKIGANLQRIALQIAEERGVMFLGDGNQWYGSGLEEESG